MSAYQSSVAHDLSRFDNRSRVRAAVAEEQLQTQATAQQVLAREHEKVALPISAWTIVCFVTVAAVICLILYSYAQAHELSVQASTLQREIEALSKAEGRLYVTYNQKVNLDEIERIAVEELGMSKPAREQIVYMDTPDTDAGVVLSDIPVEAPAE